MLLLDEPTTGLDPQARHLLWDRLYRLKQRGVTLVLTTHYMDEAEQLCDRLVVMDKAKIVAEGSPRSLIEEYATREVTELRFAPGVQETLDGQLDGLAERIERLPDRVLLYADDGEAAVAAAHARGLQPEQVLVRRSSLEDVFLRLTGRSLDRVARRPRCAAAHRSGRARLRASLPAVPADATGRRIFSSFLTPGPVPGRDGPGARLVRRPGHGRRRSAGVSYLAFLAPGPAGRDVHAVGRVRGGLPDHGRAASGRAIFHAMYATPISGRDVALGNLAWIGARMLLVATIFTVVIIAVRGGRLAAHRAGHPGRRP